ncbi:DUF4474 domain-containing protein [Desulfosporosinus hippei]|uniref:DUF4474 domain-containing protein n=1 Tax=Desulfosporosinus hippei DSM 8344 TaxID=1121419 RepID=A0A1G7ZDT1_9FIRM|nr:DUF4474 domain-containing protein [Desulfosporosinus hippei]SDH06727.1 protein of unknown function [Desulfosporosinus hippei DSM 8344]
MSIQINNDNSGFIAKGMTNSELDKVVEIAGYDYDSVQDIFYSTMNPWQRKIGYCRLFDEAAAPLGMIIDCEPIHFEYNNKKWMIGLWKGQYDLVSGGEIGVYTEAFDLKIPGFFTGTFYNCASDSDLLQMSFVLKKKGKVLFRREGEHWWLTGFKLGEFSEPSDLTMDININLKNRLMRDAFIAGLYNAGYSKADLTINGNSVSFLYATPHSEQPVTRTVATDRIIQRKNELFCAKYQEITQGLDNLQDRVAAIEEQAPELYQKIIKMGKAKPLFGIYETVLLVFLVAVATYLASRVLSEDN